MEKTHCPRPAQVVSAILDGNKKELSRLGKIGNVMSTVAKKKKRENALLEENLIARMRQERVARDFALRDREANLHICPIDD